MKIYNLYCTQNSFLKYNTLLVKGLIFLVFISGIFLSTKVLATDTVTEKVYRLQSWPSYLTDKSGVEMLSITEANATDEKDFKSRINTISDDNTLAIQFTVTHYDVTPYPAYCECNLEYAKKGCKSTDPNLKECSRQCLTGGETRQQCENFGTKRITATGGIWYSFPKFSQDTGSGKIWGWNNFTHNKVNWKQDSRIIKRAACIKQNIATTALSDLFDKQDKCPIVSDDTLNHEALQR